MEMIYIPVSDSPIIAFIPMDRIKKLHINPGKNVLVFFNDGTNQFYNTELFDIRNQLEKIMRWQ
jgi:hypothetical protein